MTTEEWAQQALFRLKVICDQVQDQWEPSIDGDELRAFINLYPSTVGGIKKCIIKNPVCDMYTGMKDCDNCDMYEAIK